MESWCRTERDYTLVVADYRDTPLDSLQRQADHYLPVRGFKFHNFLRCIEAEPELINHDYFFFVDDDIVFTPEALQQVFTLASQFGLHACQPAQVHGSTFYWRHIAQETGKVLEYTNLVEIQCFCISRHLLDLIMPILPIIKTGWGLDAVFWQLLDYPRDRMAILHSVGMFHPRRKGKKVSQLLEDFDAVSRQVEIDVSVALGGPAEPLYNRFQVQSFGSILLSGLGTTDTPSMEENHTLHRN